MSPADPATTALAGVSHLRSPLYSFRLTMTFFGWRLTVEATSLFVGCVSVVRDGDRGEALSRGSA